MWRVNELESRPVEYDYSSAGLGRHATRALYSEGDLLVNAVDLVGTEGDGSVQLIVCEQCGTVHCQPGNWVQFRKFGDALIWLPWFVSIADRNDREFAPPPFLRRRGAPFFEGATLRVLYESAPKIEAFAATAQPFALRQACELLQWEAPRGILGRFPDPPSPRSGSVIATSEGNHDDALALLCRLLAGGLASPVPAKSERPAKSVTFYLDDPRAGPWVPLGYAHDGTPLLLLLPDLGVAP